MTCVAIGFPKKLDARCSQTRASYPLQRPRRLLDTGICSYRIWLALWTMYSGTEPEDLVYEDIGPGPPAATSCARILRRTRMVSASVSSRKTEIIAQSSTADRLSQPTPGQSHSVGHIWRTMSGNPVEIAGRFYSRKGIPQMHFNAAHMPGLCRFVLIFSGSLRLSFASEASSRRSR